MKMRINYIKSLTGEDQAEHSEFGFCFRGRLLKKKGIARNFENTLTFSDTL